MWDNNEWKTFFLNLWNADELACSLVAGQQVNSNGTYVRQGTYFLALQEIQ